MSNNCIRLNAPLFDSIVVGPPLNYMVDFISDPVIVGPPQSGKTLLPDTTVTITITITILLLLLVYYYYYFYYYIYKI